MNRAYVFGGQPVEEVRFCVLNPSVKHGLATINPGLAFYITDVIATVLHQDETRFSAVGRMDIVVAVSCEGRRHGAVCLCVNQTLQEQPKSTEKNSRVPAATWANKQVPQPK